MLADVVDAVVKESMDIDEIKSLRNTISERLVSARDSGDITNDEFLSAGKIEGGMDVIIAMLENEAPSEEIRIHVESIVERIRAISS
ncbi:MAG TPA: hypothetical protein D7I12_04405 [Candidatus Poseidoniales archaeon]|nr:hypothetical protein [Euryarchaeota archaeon]DAC12896.1 MAG TPA: hypothetical protein D7H73_03680 [Candidatus Poseidoniales archaeon]DAC69264.1 MAG TPA: hypothetical protein D7I12_04405 [Candidatus Poseidoniales archaeon]|tara:strand:+ start:1071 stop:1331 length:261 start_codon:yes stop_codon:yes gene_type:complete